MQTTWMSKKRKSRRALFSPFSLSTSHNRWAGVEGLKTWTDGEFIYKKTTRNKAIKKAKHDDTEIGANPTWNYLNTTTYSILHPYKQTTNTSLPHNHTFWKDTKRTRSNLLTSLAKNNKLLAEKQTKRNTHTKKDKHNNTVYCFCPEFVRFLCWVLFKLFNNSFSSSIRERRKETKNVASRNLNCLINLM